MHFTLFTSSPAPALAALVMIPMCAIAGWRAWHGWAGSNPDEFRRIWGSKHSEALVRAMPSFSASGILLLLLALDLAYLSDTSLNAALRTAITAALSILTAASILVSASVLLLSRPRRFVPSTRRTSKSLARTWVEKSKWRYATV